MTLAIQTPAAVVPEHSRGTDRTGEDDFLTLILPTFGGAMGCQAAVPVWAVSV